MPAFTVHWSVTVGATERRVAVRLARAMPWESVRPLVCRALGLPRDAVLFHGVGPVEGRWRVGVPPLLTGLRLATRPDDDPPGLSPLVLAVVAGPDAGATAAIGTTTIAVGRDPGADLPLTDAAASRRHATVTPAAAGLTVADIGSTNGVFVDGRPAAEAGAATTGSVIRLGDSVLQVQLTAEPPGGFRPDGRGRLVLTGRHHGLTDWAPIPIPEEPAPPEEPSKRSLPVLSAVAGAVVGVALAIALSNALYLAFAAFGPLTMMATAASDRIRGRRSYRRQRSDFRAAHARWETEAALAHAAERRRAWRQWPGPAALVRRAEAAGARIWSMARADPVTVSIGCARPAVSGYGPPGGAATTASDTPAASSASSAGSAGAAATTGTTVDVPYTISIPDGSVAVFIGATGRAVARFVIAQLACHRSPADLALVVMSDRADLAVCRALPHCADPGADGPAGRRVIVVLDGPGAIGSAAGAEALRPPAAGGAEHPARVVLCLTDSAEAAPPHAIDYVSAARGAVTPTGMSPQALRRVCTALAPLYDEPRGGGVGGDAVDLASLLPPITVDSLRDTWRAPSTRAIIGTCSDGALAIDLVADGPHLLIAGTTGAGKSELLTTIVASLARSAPPDALTFLLVDYKGGAAFAPVVDLPHVVGVLTDLEPTGCDRALDSLRAELRHRERLAASGAPPSPRLVVVVDEFATLAAEVPAFLTGVLDIAQRGRSLGLHLVLATQRPAGIVSPAMRANISARICLRVTDPAESMDVIGSAAAAAIPAGHPGRAIARTSSGLIPFRAALVTVAAPPDVAVWADTPKDGPGLGPHGVDDASDTGSSPASHVDDTDRPTILRTLIDAARLATAGSSPPRRPWLPPLPERVPESSDGASGALALIDAPQEQRQYFEPPPDSSLLVFGPAGSGRSSTLRRVALLAASAGDEILVIDGAGGLRDLASWSAVTTYLTLDDPRLIARLVAILADPARRPRDGHRRLLVVDHLDLVAAELERTDYVTGSAPLAELTARAGGTVRICASGAPRLAQQRVAAGLPSTLELTGTCPGRGRWAGRACHLVDAPPGRGAAAPDGAVAAAHRSWPDEIRVRPLPATVDRASLPRPVPKAVPLGRGGDTAGPVCLDLTGPGGAFLVAGPRRSGVSTAMTVVAAQAAAAGIPVLLAVTKPGAVHGDPLGIDGPCAVVPCTDGGAALAERLGAHEGPLIVVVDHSGDDDHPAAAVFERFLAVCGAGQHLLVGTRTETALRARRGYLRAAASYRQGILLAADQQDGALFDVVIPRRSGRITPGRGFLVMNGATTPVQVASYDDAQASPRTVNSLTPAIVDSSTTER